MEAQAAGCPVIVTDGSAMSELCIVGRKVRSDKVAANGMRQGAAWWRADPAEAAGLIADTARIFADRDANALNVQQYSHKRVFEDYMKPALEKMFAIKPHTPSRGNMPYVIPSRIETLDLPKVTVITPAYNARNTIETAILSVIDQGVDVEHLIIDDGSTDGRATMR